MMNTEKISSRFMLLCLALVVVLWVAMGALPILVLDKLENAAYFGDMFGASAALFSGLAFAGVIIAILLQRQELRIQRRELILQRKELRLTRQEHSRSALAQEQSQMALADQVLSLELSAKLNALQSLVDACGYEMQQYTTGSSPHRKVVEKQKKYVRQIEELLKRMPETFGVTGDAKTKTT